MDHLVIKVGIVGYNEGNGHPFSFASILNGYDDDMLRAAGWSVIADYLAGGTDQLATLSARATAVWTPRPDMTRWIQRVANIKVAVEAPQDLIKHCDAVMILRDDWQCHASLARHFLQAGVPIFIDKPLTLDENELAMFEPHIEDGTLCSWSGLRFAPELSAYRGRTIVQIVATTVMDWDHYGLHVIEPVLQLIDSPVLRVHALPEKHEHVCLEFSNGATADLVAVGSTGTGFRIEAEDVHGERIVRDLKDRLTAFRAAIATFISTVEARQPVVEPPETLRSLRVLIAGRKALDALPR